MDGASVEKRTQSPSTADGRQRLGLSGRLSNTHMGSVLEKEGERKPSAVYDYFRVCSLEKVYIRDNLEPVTWLPHWSFPRHNLVLWGTWDVCLFSKVQVLELIYFTKQHPSWSRISSERQGISITIKTIQMLISSFCCLQARHANNWIFIHHVANHTFGKWLDNTQTMAMNM